MLQTLSSDNLVSETTCTKAEKDKIELKHFIEGFVRNISHVDNDPEDHFNEIHPEKGEINGIDNEFDTVSLSFVVN